jgi:SAM-dependent methyltransferase
MAAPKKKNKTADTSIGLKEHWNATYLKNSTEQLGWYEEKSAQTLELIKETNLPKEARILNVGAGSSILIDHLIAEGYAHIIANDLAENSLQSLKDRVGAYPAVQFLADDLLNPTTLNSLNNIDLWNDRAVLHFFLKEEEVTSYFNLLKHVLSPNGYVIIAVFAKEGAEKCCGLPLKRYDTAMLQKELGEDFELKKSFRFTFINPYGGERPYVYTLFQRKNTPKR